METETIKNGSDQVINRQANGTFAKGSVANPNGRPRNAEPELLRQALAREGEKRGINFWHKVAEVAFRDRTVMVAVLKKFVPDMTIIDADVTTTVVEMGKVILDGKALETKVGT